MGWFQVAIGVVACFLLYSAGNWIAFWVAAVATVGTIWSLGIMHNYATESAKRSSSYKGGFHDFTAKDTDAVPNSIAGLNLLFSIVSIGLLLYGAYAKFWS